MRLRDMKKLVASGGGFSLGTPVSRLSELGQQQNPLAPLNPAKTTLVEIAFTMDDPGSGVYIPVLNSESVQLRQPSLSNPGGSAPMSGSLSVFVPPGATYSINALFNDPGSESNLGATGVHVWRLTETPIG